MLEIIGIINLTSVFVILTNDIQKVSWNVELWFGDGDFDWTRIAVRVIMCLSLVGFRLEEMYVKKEGYERKKWRTFLSRGIRCSELQPLFP